MKVTAIQKWYKVHKWTSLICTIFLLMLCLTGLPLIFHEEIEHYFDDIQDAAVLPAGALMPTKDSVVRVAKAANPNKVIQFVAWDEEEHPGQMLIGFNDSALAPPENTKNVVMDLRTAKLLQAEEPSLDFMKIMLYLHVNMFLDIPGTLFLGLMGLLAMIAVVSGVVLYVPIMKRLDFGVIRTEKSERLRWLDLHNVLSIVTLAWLSVVTITGVINTLAQPALMLWRQGQLMEMVEQYKDKPKIEAELSSLDAAISEAQKAAPGMDVSFIAYPGTAFSSNHHYAVFMKGLTPLTSRIIKPALIDAETGSFTDMKDLPWFVQAILISQPFHFGDYGGIPLKIIWAILDIAAIAVLISGLYLWFIRRKAKSDHIARLTQKESLTILALEENDA